MSVEVFSWQNNVNSSFIQHFILLKHFKSNLSFWPVEELDSKAPTRGKLSATESHPSSGGQEVRNTHKHTAQVNTAAEHNAYSIEKR